MALNDFFEVPEDERIRYIEENIVARMHVIEHDFARARALSLVRNYEGRDADALLILATAAQKGMFDEVADMLECNYRKSLIYVPLQRRGRGFSEMVETDLFFVNECYKLLGIPPKNN